MTTEERVLNAEGQRDVAIALLCELWARERSQAGNLGAEMAEVLFKHRADALFNCACGWTGDGFGDPHRAHQVKELLAVVPCRKST